MRAAIDRCRIHQAIESCHHRREQRWIVDGCGTGATSGDVSHSRFLRGDLRHAAKRGDYTECNLQHHRIRQRKRCYTVQSVAILFAYQHVVDRTAYPAVLFLTGANDPRVNPANSRKMTARLQAATSSKAPVLLRTSSTTGHGIDSGLDE